MESSRSYVRFVVPVRNDGTARATGVFQVRTLCRRTDLPPSVDRRVRRAFAWFGDNLPVPPVVKEQRGALCWFRREPGRPWSPDAHEALRRAFQLASYLRSLGMSVETVQTDAPGRVLYEDRWQVVAVPGPSTPTGWVVRHARDPFVAC
jgi:hypothetical protein